MRTYLIDSKYKYVGIALLIIAPIAGALMKQVFLFEEEKIEPIFYILLLFGLVLILSAREKDEDEMILQLRLQSFQFGLYSAVIALPGGYFLNLVRGKELAFLSSMDGFLTLILAVLYVLIYFKYNLYKLKKSEKPD